jgi:hypothetical protein
VGLLLHEIIYPDCALEKAREVSVRRSTRSGGEKIRLPVACLYLGESYPQTSYVMILGQSEASPERYTRLGILLVQSRAKALRLAALRLTASKKVITIV